MIVNNRFEKEIKIAVINKLLKLRKLTRDTVVINELVIDSFSRRADLVIINGDDLVAFEIKSDADTLTRLPGQVDKYALYFDKAIVVASMRHQEKIKCLLSDDIGLWEYDSGKIKIRNGGRKVKDKKIELYFDFLKINELKKLSMALNISLLGRDKKTIKAELTAKINKKHYNEIRTFTLQVLRNKYKLKSNCFLFSVFIKGEATIHDFEKIFTNKKMKNTTELLTSKDAVRTAEDRHLEELAEISSTSLFGPIPENIKCLLDH
jgi:hypothetical protein